VNYLPWDLGLMCPAGTTYAAAGGYCVSNRSPFAAGGDGAQSSTYTVNVSACDPAKLEIFGQCVPIWMIGVAIAIFVFAGKR